MTMTCVSVFFCTSVCLGVDVVLVLVTASGRGGRGGGGGDSKSGRRKIKIEFIQDKSRRHITFSKRKAGIMKKVRFFFPILRGAL